MIGDVKVLNFIYRDGSMFIYKGILLACICDHIFECVVCDIYWIAHAVMLPIVDFSSHMSAKYIVGIFLLLHNR